MASGSDGAVRRLVDNVYLFWFLLSLPGIYLVVQRLLIHGKVAFVPLSGEIAAWLLIVTLMITPVMLLVGPLPWLKARRRNLGVASCLYSALHLGLWTMNAKLGDLIRSFIRIEILTGWIAMAIFVALALTSTDAAVRKMGPRWKALQRWIYAAAVLTLIHWVMTADHLLPVAIYTAPLIALSVWRMLRYRQRMSRA
jgi:methionine sulfoxide reductase heme-binding subunit